MVVVHLDVPEGAPMTNVVIKDDINTAQGKLEAAYRHEFPICVFDKRGGGSFTFPVNKILCIEEQHANS